MTIESMNDKLAHDGFGKATVSEGGACMCPCCTYSAFDLLSVDDHIRHCKASSSIHLDEAGMVAAELTVLDEPTPGDVPVDESILDAPPPSEPPDDHVAD